MGIFRRKRQLDGPFCTFRIELPYEVSASIQWSGGIESIREDCEANEGGFQGENFGEVSI